MRKRKTARAKRGGRVNRILGFSGTPTDEELDEAIDLMMRFVLRLIARRDFLEMAGGALEHVR